MMKRRGLLAGLGALLAAPAIIRTPGLLMPVKPMPNVGWVDMHEATLLRYMQTPQYVRLPSHVPIGYALTIHNTSSQPLHIIHFGDVAPGATQIVRVGMVAT